MIFLKGQQESLTCVQEVVIWILIPCSDSSVCADNLDIPDAPVMDDSSKTFPAPLGLQLVPQAQHQQQRLLKESKGGKFLIRAD